ncbi:hypothetical protein AB0O47_39760 [Streptomyces noursei]|uniref:hypothetical protein n=1 Tax=Streptomyces noursei TaxID=1971 RepID=UPI00344CBF5F
MKTFRFLAAVTAACASVPLAAGAAHAIDAKPVAQLVNQAPVSGLVGGADTDGPRTLPALPVGSSVLPLGQ